MKTIVLSWHPGDTTILTAGGYTRFFEIAKRSQHDLLIIDKKPSLYQPLANKHIQIIEYTGGRKFAFVKKFSPILAKLIDRSLSILQISLLLLKLNIKNDIIYVPYSELVELTIPAGFIKFIKRNKLVFCNLNVNTYFIDKPINVFLHGFANCTITLSKDLKKDLENSGIKVDEINGVGFEKEKLPTTIKMKKKYDAIYVGRHIPQKGIMDLIEIWNVLVNVYHTKAHLITIGDIPDYIQSNIRQKIKDYRLESYIELKGKVSDVEKKNLFLTSKLLVFPSRQEGWGIAPMEALSYHLPVIAYNLSIYEESIGETEAFRTIQMDDWDNFAKTIIEILDKNNYYTKQAEKWKPRLSWDEVAKKEWEIIYRV